jgi:DNA repair exonuclease SbcCD nuclease subunit
MRMTSLRIAHLADLHIKHPTLGNLAAHTLDEQLAIMHWIAGDINDREVDVVLVAGDVFNGITTPDERNVTIEIFRALSAVAPVHLVRGNHDRLGDLHYLSCLKTYPNGIQVHDRPNFSFWHLDDVRSFSMATLPWPTKSGIVGAVEDLTLDKINIIGNTAMQRILGWFRMKKPDIILAHCELGAARMISEQPLAGRCEYELMVYDLLGINAEYSALGHIHDRQEWCSDHQIVRYSGAVRHTAFGGRTDPGYTIVDINNDATITTHVPVPSRQLRTIVLESSCTYDKPIIKGDAYRLQYKTSSDEREHKRSLVEAIESRLLTDGAQSVVLDPKVRITEVIRSKSIVTATTSADQVEEAWELTGRPERGREIQEKLTSIEEELSA